MIKLYFYCQRFLNNIRPPLPWEKIIIQTFRNKAHGIGGPGAKVTRIVNGPFLSYRDFCMAIAIPGLVPGMVLFYSERFPDQSGIGRGRVKITFVNTAIITGNIKICSQYGNLLPGCHFELRQYE